MWGLFVQGAENATFNYLIIFTYASDDNNILRLPVWGFFVIFRVGLWFYFKISYTLTDVTKNTPEDPL